MSKKKVASRYDSWKGFYDLIDNFPLISRPQKGWKKDAIEFLDLQGHERILDIGTGSGQILPWIAERVKGGKVVGTDISRGMVETARERVKKRGLEEEVKVIYDDIEDSEFPDNSFDRIIATFTFTTIPDPSSAAVECARILKEEGKMVVLDTGPPTNSWFKPLFKPMMFSGKLFGRTHMDRDIHGVLKNNFFVEEVERNMLSMVYTLECTPR